MLFARKYDQGMLSLLYKEYIQIFGKNVRANLNISASDIMAQCSGGNSKKLMWKNVLLTSKKQNIKKR